MARLNSKVHRSLDAASKITLRPEASAALVAAATVNEAAVSLDALASYWDSGVIPACELEACVFVNTSAKTTNEAYQVALEVADDAAFTTNTKVLLTSADFAGKTGLLVLPLDVPTLVKLAPTAKYIRIKAIVAGAAPSLDYFAWLLHS